MVALVFYCRHDLLSLVGALWEQQGREGKIRSILFPRTQHCTVSSFPVIRFLPPGSNDFLNYFSC